MTLKAAAIGNFDGVHRGHADLLSRLRSLAAARGLVPAAITFTNHPLQLICPDRVPPLLTPPERRAELLAALGIEVITLPFTPGLRAMTAAEFLAFIRRDLGVALLLMGFNNRIGADRLGPADPALLAAASRAHVVIEVAPEHSAAEGISSSAIRALLARGDVAAAATLLGRPYELSGTVVSGRRLGRTIGFPTANVSPDPAVAVPAPGVYLARALGRKAIVNIGRRPTVEGRDDAPLSVEAHILDFSGDLYGSTLTLQFLERIRPEKRFNSLSELKAAIAADEHYARQRDI